MAELASVKVALLDIGKEQRINKGKIRRGTRSCKFQTPDAQPGSQGNLHSHADTIAAHLDPF